MDTYTILSLTDDVFSDKKVYTYSDLYKKIGLLDIVSEKGVKGKFNIENVWANKETCAKITEFLKDNLMNTKNKYRRQYRKEALTKMFAMDDLCWGPKFSDVITNTEIWLINENHPEYRQTIEI